QASEIAVVPGSGKIFAPGPFSLAIVQDAGAPPPPRDVDAISGRVWTDSNNDGRIDFGEAGLGGATVQLDGVDETGRTVSRTVTSGVDGGYQFDHLLPGVYSVRELFATSEYVDGRDSLGTVGGVPTGATANDLFTGIVLRDGDVGSGYNFGERPAPAGRVRENEVEEIGFWRNSEGQALIRSFNGGAMSTQLGDWLAATLPQTFGSLAGKTNLEVASVYVTVFRAAAGPTPKLEAQFFATALNLYATSSELGGAAGACSRFRATRFGIGASTVNVANSGSAFGLPDRAVGTVLDLLQAADRQSTGGRLYGGNSRLRQMANMVFARINEGE
ncbi:MAG TPA: SdrD B-like domain-containing protein, partial [Pirellulaceae bacterium]|nr:SdrD B-like domain-containing protein [Pirellulaceae bacterium]